MSDFISTSLWSVVFRLGGCALSSEEDINMSFTVFPRGPAFSADKNIQNIDLNQVVYKSSTDIHMSLSA